MVRLTPIFKLFRPRLGGLGPLSRPNLQPDWIFNFSCDPHELTKRMASSFPLVTLPPIIMVQWKMEILPCISNSGHLSTCCWRQPGPITSDTRPIVFLDYHQVLDYHLWEEM